MANKAAGKQGSTAIQKVYLFTGEADSRRTSAVKKIIEQVVDPDFETFDLERLDGDSSTADDILAAAGTVPFGSERKVVVVERVDRLSPDGQVRIASVIPRLGDRSCLILLAGEDKPGRQKSSQESKPKPKPGEEDEEAEEPEDEKQTKKGLQSKLASAVKANGTVTNFAKMKAQDITGLAAGMVKAHGVRIDPPALHALARAVESNAASLEREIEKLVAYTHGRGSITLADVDKVVPRPAEEKVFPLIDAVAIGRTDTAIQLLNETFSASSKPDGEVLKVIALLARHFRLLYQTKFLITEGGVRNLSAVPEETRALLMREQNPVSLGDWQRGKLLDQAYHFSLPDLRLCLKLILSCEATVKGLGHTSDSPRLSLDLLILRLSQRKAIPLG